MSIVTSLFCEHCGAANEPQVAICGFCGQPLQELQAASYDAESGGLLAGTLLKGRYRIIKPVGQGGMGTVYRAQDVEFNDRPVAIKELMPSNVSTEAGEEAIESFKREATLLAGLQHANLPSVFEHFEENGHWYMIMSFIRGETLEAYLERTGRTKLPLDEVLQIGKQLCAVLQYLHTQYPPIIFRDVKPANIMRVPDGRIYLIDFGVARRFKVGQKKDTTPFGSLGYAPPEQFGKAQTTPRSDIYSLGATMYQLLSGHEPDAAPFRFPALQTLEPTLPAPLVTLIEQMVDMDAEKRPASILFVEQKLQEISLKNAPIQPFSSFTFPSRPPSRKPLYVLAMVFVSICCLVAGGFAGDSIGVVNTRNADFAVAAATATAGVNATATAVQVAAMPDPYLPQGQLALFDPLTQANFWQEQSDSNFGGSCKFTSKGMEINQKGPSKFFPCAESTVYHNFVLEVKMTIVKGDCGSVIIRENSASSQFYPLEICSDGHYYFNIFSDPNNWTSLTRDNTPAAFNPSGQTNIVAIVAINNTFDLYANGKKIDSVQNSALSMGMVALSADAPTNDTTVVYQDVRIWALS